MVAARCSTGHGLSGVGRCGLVGMAIRAPGPGTCAMRVHASSILLKRWCYALNTHGHRWASVCILLRLALCDLIELGLHVC